jgi:hypothetical protein
MSLTGGRCADCLAPVNGGPASIFTTATAQGAAATSRTSRRSMEHRYFRLYHCWPRISAQRGLGPPCRASRKSWPGHGAVQNLSARRPIPVEYCRVRSPRVRSLTDLARVMRLLRAAGWITGGRSSESRRFLLSPGGDDGADMGGPQAVEAEWQDARNGPGCQRIRKRVQALWFCTAGPTGRLHLASQARVCDRRPRGRQGAPGLKWWFWAHLGFFIFFSFYFFPLISRIQIWIQFEIWIYIHLKCTNWTQQYGCFNYISILHIFLLFL